MLTDSISPFCTGETLDGNWNPPLLRSTTVSLGRRRRQTHRIVEMYHHRGRDGRTPTAVSFAPPLILLHCRGELSVHPPRGRWSTTERSVVAVAPFCFENCSSDGTKEVLRRAYSKGMNRDGDVQWERTKNPEMPRQCAFRSSAQP